MTPFSHTKFSELAKWLGGSRAVLSSLPFSSQLQYLGYNCTNKHQGLESNHGILMIGSTNHLAQLDPGIAKRPSRFDRKYEFNDPNREERVQYAEYWRNKLKNNKKVQFPPEMSARIADITDGFSFAYLKEAFVAALLVIVANSGEKEISRRGDPLSDNLLWNEIKRQVENLRKEIEDESASASDTLPSSHGGGMWPSLSGILPEEDRTRPWEMDLQNRTVPRSEFPQGLPRYF